MARSKLESVRRVYAAREKARAGALQKAREAREAQATQAEGLKELLAHYRQRHADSAGRTGAELARFQRFYRQVAETLDAHGRHVAMLTNAEAREELAWRGAYRASRAVADLLQRRMTERNTEDARRGRRSEAVKRSDWSMLNENDQADGGH